MVKSLLMRQAERFMDKTLEMNVATAAEEGCCCRIQPIKGDKSLAQPLQTFLERSNRCMHMRVRFIRGQTLTNMLSSVKKVCFTLLFPVFATFKIKTCRKPSYYANFNCIKLKMIVKLQNSHFSFTETVIGAIS